MRDMIQRITGRWWRDRAAVVWFRDIIRMRRLIDDFPPPPATKTEGVHAAIVLTPWSGTAVPWFSLVCGLLLGATGNRITFVLDDMPFGPRNRVWRLQIACIRSALGSLARRYSVLTLSDHASAARLDQANANAIERLAVLNVVWAQRGETHRPNADVLRAQSQLAASHTAIERALRAHRFDLVFVPGGMWGSSGVWVERSQAAGVRVASYDSGGYGTLLLAVNGIACQLHDIPRAFHRLKAGGGNAVESRLVIESALAEMDKRRSGVDKFSSQVQGARVQDPRYADGVLIALNSSWDSAALGLHTVFDSTREWIVETVRFLLENTDAPVIVRQHPVERLAIARSSDDYRTLLQQNFGDHTRLHFVAAEDPVNSYDLLEQVRAVVVYTSTIGLEAATQGKPVVTESRAYYADLGFVCQATRLDDYRAALSDAVTGRFVVSAQMRDDALACYYLTQCCNWVVTPFNVPDFPTWSRRAGLAELLAEPSVQAILRAMERDIPMAYLNHLERLGAHPTPGQEEFHIA